MIFKNVELYNVQMFVDHPEGKLLSRLPEAVRVQLNERAQQATFITCGCEIRFVLNSGLAKVKLRRIPMFPTNATGLTEVYYGNFQGVYHITPVFIGSSQTDIIIEPAPDPASLDHLHAQLSSQHGASHIFDPNVVRIILPYDDATYLVDIEGDVRPPLPEQVPQTRYLAYGSSITQGGSAVRPTETYAMQVARLLGADLINLGFSGSAHMESAMADYIASRNDWDFATLEMGINVIELWSPEMFANCVEAFVQVIARHHPDKWIFCIDLFQSVFDVSHSEKVAAFRWAVEDTVARLDLPRLVYVSGRELLTETSYLTVDLVHPSPLGMEQIAQRLSERIRRYVTG